MNNRIGIALSIILGLGLWGCATGGGSARVEAPPVERTTYYYAGGTNVTLKSAPDPSSQDKGRLTLNEQVQMLKRNGSWFLVQAKDGSQGWVDERYLTLRPVDDFYVRRWGRLRSAPQAGSKSVGRLRVNDQVKVLETNPAGWAKVSVKRTGDTGWIEMTNLSTSKVAVRRYRKSGAGASKTGGAEEAASEAATPAGASGLGPKAAEAAESPAKKAPSQPKVRPEMFDAF